MSHVSTLIHLCHHKEKTLLLHDRVRWDLCDTSSKLTSHLHISPVSQPLSTTMSHIPGSSVRDHMKWVSSLHVSLRTCYFPLIRLWTFALIPVPNPLVLTHYHIKYALPATTVYLLFFVLMLFFKAGLLGCEAVLSSMALMQASSIAAPKKMMSPLGPASGHGSAQRDAQDRGTQGHMVLPTSMTCPPLVRRHLKAID